MAECPGAAVETCQRNGQWEVTAKVRTEGLARRPRMNLLSHQAGPLAFSTRFLKDRVFVILLPFPSPPHVTPPLPQQNKLNSGEICSQRWGRFWCHSSVFSETEENSL